LKETNQKFLDAFAEKDQEYQKHTQLNSNARREINFKAAMFEQIRQSIMNLDPRERFQESNLRGLKAYAKKLTIELNEQKEKVVMSEQIIADLKKAGSDDMGSLVDMLNSYKEKEAVSQEAIDQLKELQVHKDDEIMGLEVEVQSLRDFMGGVRATQEAKIEMYRQEIEQNAKVIRR
jgi:hypothetical protein